MELHAVINSRMTIAIYILILDVFIISLKAHCKVKNYLCIILMRCDIEERNSIKSSVKFWHKFCRKKYSNFRKNKNIILCRKVILELQRKIYFR